MPGTPRGIRPAGTSADTGQVLRPAAPAHTSTLRQPAWRLPRWAASGAPVPVPPSPHQGVAIGDDWPLRDALELGSLPGAVPCARLHARQLLWEWGLSELSENGELLVTELVTNAIAASRSVASRSVAQILPVRLWLLADRARVLILVWDASPRPPAPVNTSQDAESGRGLLLVEAISQRWDWYFPHQTGGKIVWALVAYENPVSGR